MNTTAKIALAASGGYFLGRTKKMKLAAMLALFLAGQKLPKSPVELLQQGAGALAKSDQFKELSQQVTGSLLEAGKVAASRSAERWLTGVGDKLRDGIPGPDSGDAAPADESEDVDEGTDEGTDDQGSEQESEQNGAKSGNAAKKSAGSRQRSTRSSGSSSQRSGSAKGA